MGDSRSAYVLLSELFGVQPSPQVLHELIRRLAQETRAVVQVWRVRPDGLSVELSWPTEVPGLPAVIDARTLDSWPGVVGCALRLARTLPWRTGD